MIMKPEIKEKKLTEVVYFLISSDSFKYNNRNLLGDKTGASLFMFYYSMLSKKEEHYNFAFEILEEVAGIHSTIDVIPTSISKFGWLLQHLNRKGIIETDLDELFENADVLLYNSMIKSLQNNIYDFLHGALGIALYFLNKEAGDKKADIYLTEFINEMAKISEGTHSGGIKWISFIDYKKETKAYNISMSHGITSIIAVLSKIYKRKINLQKTKHLLEGAVNHLLKQKLPKDEYNSIFPNLALESMDKLYASRLAWCYGDLGISVALWHASQALGRKDSAKRCCRCGALPWYCGHCTYLQPYVRLYRFGRIKRNLGLLVRTDT